MILECIPFRSDLEWGLTIPPLLPGIHDGELAWDRKTPVPLCPIPLPPSSTTRHRRGIFCFLLDLVCMVTPTLPLPFIYLIAFYLTTCPHLGGLACCGCLAIALCLPPGQETWQLPCFPFCCFTLCLALQQGPHTPLLQCPGESLGVAWLGTGFGEG